MNTSPLAKAEFENIAGAAIASGQTLPQMLIAACQRYGGKPAFTNLDHNQGFSEFDDKCGEAVKLVVVRNDPALTEEDLRAHCRKLLTGYQQPKVVEFRDALPKSAVGKVLRRELR